MRSGKPCASARRRRSPCGERSPCRSYRKRFRPVHPAGRSGVDEFGCLRDAAARVAVITMSSFVPSSRATWSGGRAVLAARYRRDDVRRAELVDGGLEDAGAAGESILPRLGYRIARQIAFPFRGVHLLTYGQHSWGENGASGKPDKLWTISEGRNAEYVRAAVAIAEFSEAFQAAGRWFKASRARHFPRCAEAGAAFAAAAVAALPNNLIIGLASSWTGGGHVFASLIDQLPRHAENNRPHTRIALRRLRRPERSSLAG